MWKYTKSAPVPEIRTYSLLMQSLALMVAAGTDPYNMYQQNKKWIVKLRRDGEDFLLGQDDAEIDLAP